MLSTHIKKTKTKKNLNKTIIYGKVTFQSKLYWDLKYFLSAMTILVWPFKDKKTPQTNLKEMLMMERWCLLRNEEESDFAPPHFSFYYKTVADLVLGAESSHPPVSTSHKCPVLRNHLLSIALPLAEFFLCLDINKQSSSEHPSSQNATQEFQSPK